MKRETVVVVFIILFLTVAFAVYVASLRIEFVGALAALVAFAFFISLYLLLGDPSVIGRGREIVGRDRGKVLGAALLLVGAYSAYALVVGRFRWADAGMCALYLLVPTGALTLWRPKADGLTVQDGLAIVALWFPIEFDWIRLASVPPEHGQGLAKIIGLIWAVFLFLVVRRLEGVGYTFELKFEDVRRAGLYFALFATFFAIPLAVPTHFVASSPTMRPLSEIAVSLIGIAFFIALPEELLFRGVIHNLIARRLTGKPALALVLSSTIFGLAHANNPNEPVWVYVVLATIAGWFYGVTYVRTGKVTAAALTHWLVDSYWSIFFHR